ncbi:MAG: acyl-CoA dehydrogenase protein [uncultured bacterium]|nr:MAG: acyl-CoA dehydrogenase protein [uncultured bacterium]
MSQYYLDPKKRYGLKFYEYIQSFQKISLEIDENPNSISKFYNLPAINFILFDRNVSVFERTRYFEALGYGDPGVLLASPGPSLSGLLIQEIGNKNQIDFFYSLVQSYKMQTFFGLTEPNRGSDISNMECRLNKVTKNKYRLSGSKAFFGNGAVGKTGVVFAKIAENPAGIRAIWITPEMFSKNKISRQTLPMFGLRGSQIATMEFHDVEISAENILGNHLSSCQAGLLSIATVFNRLKSSLGALALGQAQFICDLLFLKNHNISPNSLFSTLDFKLNEARNLLLSTAQKIDQNPFDSMFPSIAKITAVRAAEFVISTCLDHFKLEDLFENPLILKAYRDVYCWEFMEGTTNIQKNIIAQHLNHKMNKIKLLIHESA